MITRTRRWLLLASILLAPSVRARAQAFEITQDELDRAVALIAPAIREECHLAPEFAFRARLSTADEVERVLVEENRPIMKVQFSDEAVAERQAVQFARTLAPALLAKYAFGVREVLVVPAGFARVSKVLSNPALESQLVFQAVLVHELVHAADDSVFGFATVLVGLTNAETIQAYNSVFEGHAQHVARKVCRALGWSEGFDTFTSSIGAVAASGADGAGVEFLQKAVAANFATSYYDGERFIAAIEKEGGAAAIARAFSAPPKDLVEVFEPKWFLHPEQRPALRFDLDGALAELSAEYEEDFWTPTHVSLTPAQLQVGFSAFPEEVREPLIRSVRQNRVLVLTPEESPGSKQITIALFELPSPAEASLFYEANERLLRSKDELMKTGAIRILDAKYEPLERPGMKGVVVHKSIAVQGQTLPYHGLTGARGCIAFELGYSNGEFESEILARVEKMIERAESTERKTADEPATAPVKEKPSK